MITYSGFQHSEVTIHIISRTQKNLLFPAGLHRGWHPLLHPSMRYYMVASVDNLLIGVGIAVQELWLISTYISVSHT